MINTYNEPIFNYIFTINEDIRAGIKSDCKEYRNKLDEKIKKISEIEDFWDEYKGYFNDEFVIIENSIIGKINIYNNFPRMKIETKRKFLDYKSEQIKRNIHDNGDFIKDEIERYFTEIDNIGRKAILDYCKENEIIEYKGKTFVSTGDSPVYAIIYDNIKAKIIKNNNSGIFEQKIYQNINYGNNYGTFNQTNSTEDNEEELYKTIIQKLELIQIENKLSDEKIEEIRKACDKKEKNKVINILMELALSTSSNLIASGILNMFGLM